MPRTRIIHGWTCEHCGEYKERTDEAYTTHHGASHSGVFLFRCGACPQSFKTIDSLMQHLKYYQLYSDGRIVFRPPTTSHGEPRSHEKEMQSCAYESHPLGLKHRAVETENPAVSSKRPKTTDDRTTTLKVKTVPSKSLVPPTKQSPKQPQQSHAVNQDQISTNIKNGHRDRSLSKSTPKAQPQHRLDTSRQPPDKPLSAGARQDADTSRMDRAVDTTSFRPLPPDIDQRQNKSPSLIRSTTTAHTSALRTSDHAGPPIPSVANKVSCRRLVPPPDLAAIFKSPKPRAPRIPKLSSALNRPC